MRVFFKALITLVLLALAANIGWTGYEMGSDSGYQTGSEYGFAAGEECGFEQGYQEAMIEADYWREIAEREADPRHLESLQELHYWLYEDDTDSLDYIPSVFDCEDFAERLMKNALQDGYLLPIYLEWREPEYHALNCAFIGNEFWVIEPQNDDTWLLATLD